MFDDSIMTRSLVQDFSLVCDREGIRTVVNISYMMGEYENYCLAKSRLGPWT